MNSSSAASTMAARRSAARSARVLAWTGVSPLVRLRADFAESRVFGAFAMVHL
jgi:hypothetical protein